MIEKEIALKYTITQIDANFSYIKIIEVNFDRTVYNYEELTRIKDIKIYFKNNGCGNSYEFDYENNKMFLSLATTIVPFIVNNKQLDIFIEAVEEINKKFSIPIRPRAKTGETYYYIGPIGNIVETVDLGTENDKKLYDFGNYFIDEYKVQKYQKRVKENWNCYRKQQVDDLK